MKNLKRFGVKYPMTCNYRPYTKEDKLEVGTKIRLGGREGEITDVRDWGGNKYDLIWEDGDLGCLYLDYFTFEIKDTPLPPLTIDKRVRGEIFTKINTIVAFGAATSGLYGQSVNELVQYLNSLEET